MPKLNIFNKQILLRKTVLPFECDLENDPDLDCLMHFIKMNISCKFHKSIIYNYKVVIIYVKVTLSRNPNR